MWAPFLLGTLAGCGTAADGDSGSGTTTWTPGASPSTGPVVLKVAGWNVEGLGRPDSTEYEATRDILARLDADVVALSELDEGEGGTLEQLASELGYGWRLYPADNPFGPLRLGLLAKRGVVESTKWTSADLSGDGRANDLTRLPLEVRVEAGGRQLRVIGTHLKSGFDDADLFRRAVDAARVAQASQAGASAPVVVVGDLNAELEDGPESPDPWTRLPAGLPSSYDLGNDLAEALAAGELRNTPFAPLQAAGLTVVDATQLDGRTATRDSSDRRIDYALVTTGVAVRGEVYDSRDDDGSGIAQGSPLPDRDASSLASDHFAILVELTL